MSTIQFTGNSGDFLKIGVKAAARGDIESVREILKAKPKWLHQVGSHGRTMLWEACHRGKLEMVKYLVRRKSNIDACGSHYTPYFVEVSCYCIARFKKHHKVADFLESKGAVFDIHTAAFLGDLSAVKDFVRQDRKLIHAGHVQHDMVRNGPVDFAPVEAPWATPLCYALRGGTSETVEFLIKKKSRIKGFEKTHFNAANDDFDKLKLLLENGADPKFCPGFFPDDKSLFELVSSYGVKPPNDETNSIELVYLCRGDRGGNPAEVQRLINFGADVDYQDHKGLTAVHRAAKSGFVKALDVLLENGADLEIEDPKGETPLFAVARSTIKKLDHLKSVARILLQSGANLAHENHKGETAFDVARKSKRWPRELAKLLAVKATPKRKRTKSEG